MATRSRKLLMIVLAILLVIGGGLLYLSTQLNSIVAGLIESQGSAVAGSPVRVSGVAINLGEANASISGLSVANPDGFGGGHAIDLGSFSVRIDPASVTTDTIVLKEVTVSDAQMTLLQRGTGSNLQSLLNQLQSSSDSGSAAADSGAGKKLIIDRFTLKGARATVSVPDLQEEREISLPDIVLTDIGRASNGATAGAVARQVLEPVLQKALSTAAAQSLKERASDELNAAKDQLLKGVMDKLGSNDEDVTP
ncbi:DUF748 domain-containing protein [Woeseia oceani]|uniref:AsmA domain-containing protein n=1 Tax=Woeseia oceani TaxID=1548547 RepID=A0A193LC84_9GAMM|nr:hypothetical protein [Woeseia oceani]ANO50145.1 hypothetical protein BA177_01960 [Woeseia oceani]